MYALRSFSGPPKSRRVLHAILICVILMALRVFSLPHEPRFHVRPPANWINDPNGPYRDPITQKMHLYMQYNPDAPVWGNINWYHFTSMNYVKWKDENIALRNTESYENRGAYSGSITHNADGTPVVMYTCAADGDVQRQCIALPTAADVASNGPRSLNSFEKLSTNPVLTVSDIPGYVASNNFRDPTNFWVNPDNASEWLVAFVAGIQENSEAVGVAHVVVFATGDPKWLSDFHYSHSIWNETTDFYRMLECPDFFKIGEDYYLKVSTMISGQDYWVYGSYARGADADSKTVYNEDPSRTPTYIDVGRWYASKQNHDPILDRFILWGWIPEEQSDADMTEMGWSGTMDMPRNVEYDATARKLKTFPMPELSALRISERNQTTEIEVNEAKVLYAKAPLHYEMIVDFTIPANFTELVTENTDDVPSFGVLVRYNNNDVYTRIAVTMPPMANIGEGYDQNGRTFQVLNVTTSVECGTKCDSERRCVAWTAVDVSTETDPTIWRCTLMSTLESVFEANSSAVTGRVQEPILLMNRTLSGTTGFTTVWSGRAPITGGTAVQLRVFVDDSIIQVFKDGGLESLTGRVYVPAEFAGVALFSSNIDTPISARVSLYELDSVYETDAAVQAVGAYPLAVMLLSVCLHIALLQLFL